MLRIRSLLLLLLPLFPFSESFAQIGYSPVVDSLIQQINPDSLLLFNRQLSGDTSVVINGSAEVLETRHASYPGNSLAAQFIFEKFQAYGLDTRFQNYSPSGQNVLTTLEGTVFPSKVLILCAHYDDMPNSALAPGADDNASGVAALFEAARLISGLDFTYTLRLIAFDEEEVGFLGSTAYVDSAYYAGEDILGVLNLDMIAWDGNDDSEVSVATNDASMSMLYDNFQAMRIYRPELSPHLLIAFGGSDHYRFWGKFYKAIMLEEDRKDFNPFYHTVNDHVSNINLDYACRLTQAALATFLSMAWDLRMTLVHQPLDNVPVQGNRIVSLVLDPQRPSDTVYYPPRMYFRIDDRPFEHITPYSISQGTCDFLLPPVPYGSKVSYYFAVQDSARQFAATLPVAGKGVNPPGAIPPPSLFSYYVIKDTALSVSASGLPVTIPIYDTLIVALPLTGGGRLLDANVGLSITHTKAWDLDIFLKSPSGQLVELSTDNGFMNDHYISTLFDDEAWTYIHENKPPFTGSFKPEMPLSILDDQAVSGEWQLMVINQGNVTGKVNSFFIDFLAGRSDLYVDAGVSESGDGLSWPTALKTISEACLMDPGAGQTVFIRSGIYEESVTITSNGGQVIPLTTGIGVLSNNVVQFPAGTDLSAIDLENHPGEYYAYLYRSRVKNSGMYLVKEVDDAADQLILEHASFIAGSGSCGDTNALSCCVGRPVVYKRYSSQAGDDRVVLDMNTAGAIPCVLFIGAPDGNDTISAAPANFNLIDGIDLTGANSGCGVQIQNSSYNCLINSSIYNINGTGIRICGDEENAASYNFILNNLIHDTHSLGVCVGRSNEPWSVNHANYNHIIGNEITTVNTNPAYDHSGAILICSFNCGNTLRDNYIHDLVLSVNASSALDIQSHANFTMVSANRFRNVMSSSAEECSLIRLRSGGYKVDVFNNVLSDSLGQEGSIYAFRIDASGADSCRVVHNTVYQVANGFLLEDYTDFDDFDIQNNIIEVPGEYYTNLGVSGRYHVAFNLYAADPAPEPGMPYYGEEGRQIGTVEFKNAGMGDFQILVNSDLAICNGAPLSPAVAVDPERNFRFTLAPDIGAYELREKKVWLGTVSGSWQEEANWSDNSLPDSTSNIVILQSEHDPILPPGVIPLGGIVLEPGTYLKLSPGTELILLKN